MSKPVFVRSRLVLILSACLGACWHGCAQRRPSPSLVEAMPASAEVEAKAQLRLSEILPVPQFPATTTAPTPTSGPAQARRAIRCFRRGRDLFEQQRWYESSAALEEALRADSRMSDARLLHARATLQQGDYESATESLRTTLSVRPRSVAAHQMLGEIAWAQNRPEAAIASLRLAILAEGVDLNRPEVVLARLTLSLALMREGYLTAAADQLELYLAKVRQPTPAMLGHHELAEVMSLYRGRAAGSLGEIRTRLGDHEAAGRAYRQAVSERPDDAGLRRQYVLALARSGLADEAFEGVRSWPADCPRQGEGFDLLREVCEWLGQPERFDAEFARMAKGAADPQLRVDAAKRLAARGKITAAVEILEGTIAAESTEPDAAYLLARLHADAGRMEASYKLVVSALRGFPDSTASALAILTGGEGGVGPAPFIAPAQRLVADKPSDAFARFGLGVLLSATGKQDAALDELLAATRLRQAFGPAAAAAARILEKQDRWQDAIDLTATVVAAGATDVDVQTLKGLAHDALDEVEAAEAAFLEAFRLDRDSPVALFHLARSAERRGERRRCEQLYRRITDEVDPRFIPAREKLVRLYMNSGNYDRAGAYFSDFERLGLSGPAVDRCSAMIHLPRSTAKTPEARLEEYQASLREILAAHPDDAETHLDLAKSYVAVHAFDDAMTHAKRVTTIDPAHIAGRELKATLHAKQLKFDLAADVIRDLLKDRPRDIGYMQNLLEFANNLADHDTAIDLLEAFSAREDLRERSTLFRMQLIAALDAAGRHKQEVAVAEHWLAEAPDQHSRRQAYLDALAHAGRHDEAVSSARAYLEADPDGRGPRLQYLSQLQAARRYTEAQQHVLGWLADAPEDFELNHALIRLCWSAEAWDDAIDIARTGAEMSEHRARYEDRLGRSYLLARRFDDAVAFYRDRAALFETDASQRALLSSLVQARRYAEAERVANKVLRSQLDEQAAGRDHDVNLILSMRNYLAVIFQETDRNSRALEQMEAMFELAPDDPGINNDLGYTYADAGLHLDMAEKMIRFSLSASPRSSAGLDSLGWVLYKKGRFAQAVHYLRRALRMADRDDPVLDDHLGDALYRLGEREEAKTCWKKAYTLCNPDNDPPPDARQRKLRDAVRGKLDAMENGQAVETAAVVECRPQKPRP